MKTKMFKTVAVSLGIMGATLFFSCTKESQTAPATNSSANYSVYLKDAPADYQAVNVNITGVAVKTSVSGWVQLHVKAGVYNLLTLTNGTDTLIASGNIAAGNVTQIQLQLAASGNTVVVNHVTYPLMLSASAQSGVTINVNTIVSAGSSYSAVVDFDAGLSVQASGQSNFTLNPVLSAVSNAMGAVNISGTIEGTLNPYVAMVPVVAINTAGSLGFGISDSTMTFSALLSGGFQVPNLVSGTYKVVVMPGPPYTAMVYNNITVAAGQVTNMGTLSLQ
jgi:Domain of unknown function (DUF4382)